MKNDETKKVRELTEEELLQTTGGSMNCDSLGYDWTACGKAEGCRFDLAKGCVKSYS